MARGLTIASAWITFLAIAASIILLAISGSMEMKAGATDADRAKARQLSMAGFWVLVVAGVFGLIAAISASCNPGMGRALDSLRRRLRDCEADRLVERRLGGSI